MPNYFPEYNPSDDDDDDYRQAQFSIETSLPPAEPSLLEDAREAVRREFRDSVKWKHLRCRNVELYSHSETGSVFVLQIDHAIDFDWSWEGAIAFRPLSLNENTDERVEFLNDHILKEIDIEDSTSWSGDILEVDEAEGRLFVLVSNPEYRPTTGSFYVRPYEFLSFINTIYNEPSFSSMRHCLPNRLLATEGNVHPNLKNIKNAGLKDLQEWWSKSWSILWGPPGTGKTYTTGQQVASVLGDTDERILVVSTTNRATDTAAISIGRAAKQLVPHKLEDGLLVRIGKGANLESYIENDLTHMLRGTETGFLSQIEKLSKSLTQSQTSGDKALIRKEIKELLNRMRDSGKRNFLNRNIEVVTSTAFKAISFLNNKEVQEGLANGYAPFTTIFIDEAGLISRAATAALSMLASRRVVLVGDSKQLSPISRINRLLPTNQMKWLAMSGLSHLDSVSSENSGVHILREQRRMHRDICTMISNYMYNSTLVTAPEVNTRRYTIPLPLNDKTRAIWYVLDDHGANLPAIRAERGPGNRSWIRTVTESVLDRLFANTAFKCSDGLFISPFKAQANSIGRFFVDNEINDWKASTVHSQQGAEADIVIFDTVNAGSYSWSYDEWQRLVNVAISRARQYVIILSSRAEMNEPYLQPLIKYLQPQILERIGRHYQWKDIAAEPNESHSIGMHIDDPSSLGYQIAMRKKLRPVLSHEQQRLCCLELDNKPRLVRGVAGSGKTQVLANWLSQTVKRFQGQPVRRIWVIYGNQYLQKLLADSISNAWNQANPLNPFPWHSVSLIHIRDVVQKMLQSIGRNLNRNDFNYDAASKDYLSRVDLNSIQDHCDALFIDEAQDMGPNTLKLLTSLTRKSQSEDDNSRNVNIFYDNAQNIYYRGTPRWPDIGLDMRGRSTIMNESFRSTKPIVELALNVLSKLEPQNDSQDHKELIARGLIEQTNRNNLDWWSVRFNQVEGPKPELRLFASLDQEFAAIAEYCRSLVQDSRVQPSDVCIIYNNDVIKQRLENEVAPVLRTIGVGLACKEDGNNRSPSDILMITSASFKGYDSEIVIIPAVDYFQAKSRGILAPSLYVAMTRARSVLTLFAHKSDDSNARIIIDAIQTCLDALHERPSVESEFSVQDDHAMILSIIGEQHRGWLKQLWTDNRISQVSQEPILTKTGEVIAEPLFHMQYAGRLLACFEKESLPQRTLDKLKDHGIELLKVGQYLT